MDVVVRLLDVVIGCALVVLGGYIVAVVIKAVCK